MCQSRVQIDCLPNEFGSSYGQLWGAISFGTAAGICLLLAKLGLMEAGTAAYVALALSFCGSIMWFLFWRRFAMACRQLPGNESTYVMILAWISLISPIIANISLIAESKALVISVRVLLWIWFGVYIMLGISLKKHYTGLLGEIGANIIKSFWMLLLGVPGIILLTVIGALIDYRLGGILLVVGAVVYVVAAIVILYQMVWDRIVEIIERGFFVEQ